ncbi:MAG: molecular chaperone [Aliivibrio sp.]|uniref:fimbrial biogenesis chaperone n=1 Tax=Aliivibrio sp. TaxID=1872443 RepID=UPI001A37D271|nr:molecular chaperone [Aliivibrio sp.]
MKTHTLCFMLTLLLSHTSFASLLVVPTRVELDNKNRSATMSVVNKASETTRYNVYFEDNIMLANGEYQEIKKGESTTSSSKFIRYSPRRFTLKPEESGQVRLALRIPQSTVEAEYRSYIVFHQIPVAKPKQSASKSENLSLAIKAYLRIAIPVILRVGELDANISVDKSSQYKNRSVIVTLNRTGLRSSYGDIEIYTKNKNRLVGSMKRATIYPELERREFVIPLSEELASGSKIVIKYTESSKLHNAKSISMELTI